MRFIYKYNIDSVKLLTKKLLSYSKKVNYSSIFISNNTCENNSLPKDYLTYDLIAGIDSIDELICNNQAINRLNKFRNTSNDWLFGALSYDLKNEIEDLSSENKDKIQSNLVSFFIPKYVFLLSGKELKVLTYEKKKNVDSIIFYSKNLQSDSFFNINLNCRESKIKYLNKIEKIKEHIQRGDVYELNYCIEFFAEDVLLSPYYLFHELNKKTNNPFAGFLKIKNQYILSASPERFLRKDNNQLISQPIKGTIRRGEDFQEDIFLINYLKNNSKEISENIMITDLVRNDMSITALNSSVNVQELCKVYTFEKIHQMITTIVSEVKENQQLSSLLKSMFPMGSMTGAPKLKAMQLIDLYEEFKRGYFSGSIGYIKPNGNFDFNVIIRSILYNKDLKYLSVGVGGAITIKSDPHKEYEECITKIRPILEIFNKEY